MIDSRPLDEVLDKLERRFNLWTKGSNATARN
jgi:hypothetical protein